MRVRAFRGWRAGLSALAVAAAMVPRTTLGIGIEDVVDGGNTYNWQRVELPGTVCSNGSQYRFWYYDSPTSNNLLISFEGGGACWDYPSCSGQTGILGAANPNGIPTDYITQMKATYVSPLVNGAGIKNKILEALAMRLPVVATPLSMDGISVKHGESALIAPIDMMAGTVIALLQDRDQQTRLGEQGRMLIEEKYSWEHVAAQYRVLYKEFE